MTKTTNYNLNQWDAADPIRREDFNADNAAIDAAMGALAEGTLRMQSGTYTGTGTYGADGPTVLTLPFPAEFILIWGSNAYLTVGISGRNLNILNGGISNWLTTEWSAGSISWYTTNSSYSQWQMNEEGQVYHYFAIG